MTSPSPTSGGPPLMRHFVASRVHEVTGQPLLQAELELLEAADLLMVESEENLGTVLRSGDEVAIDRCRREVTVAFEWAALLTCDVMAGKLRGGTTQAKAAKQDQPLSGAAVSAPQES